jgi:hypothetical protein
VVSLTARLSRLPFRGRGNLHPGEVGPIERGLHEAGATHVCEKEIQGIDARRAALLDNDGLPDNARAMASTLGIRDG